MKSHPEEISFFLKALADESRITILRYLNQEELPVGDLAEKVNLGEPTVSHHLTRLREAGFVSLRAVGNQRFYRLNLSGLSHFKQLIDDLEQFPDLTPTLASDDRWIDTLGWSSEDSKVLREHTRNGKITHLPGKQVKTLVILRWLATLFQPDVLYSEMEVNQILKNVYEEDYVSLRRDLIDMGYLRRERGGGKYWLAPTDSEAA